MSKQMQPGPELDVAVEVAIFGSHIIKNHSYADSSYGTRSYCKPPGGGMCLVLKYSRDHNAVWRAVEKAGVSTITIDPSAENNPGSVECWLQICGELELGCRHTLGSTVPHAICLALLAKPESY